MSLLHITQSAALVGLASITTLAATTNSDSDRLFDWAESAYPTVLSNPTPSASLQNYYYRCYAGNTLCIATRDGNVYAYQNGTISNLGSLASWLMSAAKDQVENGKIFPLHLSAASPTQTGSGTAKNSFSATSGASYAAVTEQINSLLNGSASPTSRFNGAAFLAESADAGCFGPQLAYTGHPDAGTGPSSGTLPGGDLGLWRESDNSTGDACAAAQLNARLDGSSQRANMALIGISSLLRQAIASGIGLPAAGSTVDLTARMNSLGLPNTTFTSATLSLDATGKIWSDVLNFSWRDGSGVSHAVNTTLQHTPGSSSTSYQGILTWSVTLNFNGGNCGSGSNPVTRIGTLKYNRTSSTSLQTIQRNGQYCGSGTFATLGSFESDGQLSAASSWADSFSRFGASFDPATLKGKYLLAWQAGAGDANSRLLQLGLNGSTSDGEAYFGYGAGISTTTGSILGFNCAWAAPKPASPIGLHKEYAQRQFIRLSSTSGKWETPSGGANIRFAPTDACTYSGSGSFWYDRNIDGVVNETASDLTVTTPDLMGLGSSATIADAIAARGYVIPSF